MAERRLNGAAVRAIRSALGISQADLAARIRKSPGYLSRLEQGVQSSDAPKIQRDVADALGVSLEAVTYPVVVGLAS